MVIIFLNLILFVIMVVFACKEKNASYAGIGVFFIMLFGFEIYSDMKFDSEYVAISGIDSSVDFSNVQNSSIMGEYGTTIDDEVLDETTNLPGSAESDPSLGVDNIDSTIDNTGGVDGVQNGDGIADAPVDTQPINGQDGMSPSDALESDEADIYDSNSDVGDATDSTISGDIVTN